MRVPPSGGDFSSLGSMPPYAEAKKLSQEITNHLRELYTASKDGTLTHRDLKLEVVALRAEIDRLRELEQKSPLVFTPDQEHKTEDLYKTFQDMASQIMPPTTDQFHEALQMAQDLKF